jgi:hypothetical protein
MLNLSPVKKVIMHQIKNVNFKNFLEKKNWQSKEYKFNLIGKKPKNSENRKTKSI